MLWSLLGMGVLIWPLFISIERRSEIGAWVACTFFLVAKTAYTGAMLPVAAQSFPTARRFTGLALSYNVAVVVFGGTAPALCTAMIAVRGTYAAALYVCLVVLMTAGAVWRMRDVE